MGLKYADAPTVTVTDSVLILGLVTTSTTAVDNEGGGTPSPVAFEVIGINSPFIDAPLVSEVVTDDLAVSPPVVTKVDNSVIPVDTSEVPTPVQHDIDLNLPANYTNYVSPNDELAAS